MRKNPNRNDKATQAAWYQKNREQILAHYATKKESRRICSIQWNKENPERRREIDTRSKRKRENQNPYDLSGERMFRRMREQHLTLDQYHALAEKQDFCCAICSIEPLVKPHSSNHIDGFVIDHNHVNGKVRGLLCPNCNVALGQLRDNPATARHAATYLETHSR